MDAEEIKQQLINKNVEVNECVPMKGKSEMSCSYLITTIKDVNIGEIKKISAVDNVGDVSEERNNVQCYRSQRFGHGAVNCNLQPRCVKCAGTHLTVECSMQKTAEAKAACCNCGGDHPANFSKCPLLEAYLDKKLRPAVKTINKPALIRERISYASITRGETNQTQTKNDFDELASEFQKLNQLCDIKNSLQTVNCRT